MSVPPRQDRVVSEAGEMLAALHGLDPEPLHGILGPADWAGFLAGQRATAPERQCQVKLPDLWLSQIDGFLASVPPTPRRERVLLHTEVIREHLVVNPCTCTATCPSASGNSWLHPSPPWTPWP